MNDTENDEKSYSVHAQSTFILPPQAETIIEGKPDTVLQQNTTGIITARKDLPERYSIVGAAEIVNLSKENTVPIRLLNPTAKPIKIYRRTRIGEFFPVDSNIETFELNCTRTAKVTQANIEKQEERDYSSLPDLDKC